MVNLISNSKMKELLDNLHTYPSIEMLELNIQQLNKLLFPPFKKVKDCVIISQKSVDKLESTFDDAIKMYMDKTGYEASNTETRINDYFENEISLTGGTQIALMVMKTWALQLKQIEPNTKFCLIICSDEERVEIRFHKMRDTESGWLVKDLEEYKDGAVGCILI